MEWVLRSNFGFGKLYRKGSADYSDCLHAALAAQAGEQRWWTFDKTAAKLDGARLLA